MKGNDSKDSALSPKLEDNIYIGLMPSTEVTFMQHPFKLSVVSRQYPRKNQFQFYYKSKSWMYDVADKKSPSYYVVNSPNSSNSPNSTLDYDSSPDNHLRILSRSAKIMRQLSNTSCSFRSKDIGIKKLLTFDSTPSPKTSSSYENSDSPINADTPSTLDTSLTTSTDSNTVPTAESIDENQNQTPQQTRKHKRIDESSDETEAEFTWGRTRTSYLMSLLQNERKGKAYKDASHPTSSHFLRWRNQFDNRSSRVITASTPRNLSQEFNQEIHDRPHTPENVIKVVPESISAIKNSHRKEKLYCHKESSARQPDVSTENDDSVPGTSTESSEMGAIAETSTASEDEFRKKNRSTKRTLVYSLNNEHSDVTSDSDRSMRQKTPMEIDLSGLDQIESDEMRAVDSSDSKSHEKSMQVSMHLMDDEREKDRSEEDVCSEELSWLSWQKESSSGNASTSSEGRTASPESNPIASQDAGKVVTPENHGNVLKHLLTESIKKSHKKMKHGNRKQLFQARNCKEMESARSEISLETACNDDQDVKSRTADTICVSSPQNFEFSRPSTPENVNSSRLLLLRFNSVKKSHRKDKRSKRTCSFSGHHEHLASLENQASSVSSGSKKRSRTTSLQSSTPKMPSTFVSSTRKNIDDEFKIYTPIKKSSILLTVTDYVPADEMSREKGESAQATNEIDYSRCVTPVARFKEFRKNEDLSSTRATATEFETDTNVLEIADAQDKNGRSTPINMSTMELLHNKDSIKMSHRKDKHSRNRSGHVSFTSSNKMLGERTASSMKHRDDSHLAENEICGIAREKDYSYNETDYGSPQPSTSRGRDNFEDAKSIMTSKFLNTTPPNSLTSIQFVKLLRSTSIKKSHKKERDTNAQTKYIFMSQEHELSDDGSIFDEEDKLHFMDINDNNTEITTM